MNRAPFSLSETWNHVGEVYGWIISLFGAPGEIAERLLLPRAARRDLLAWLAPVEALARRLLLLKALTLPPLNHAPAPAPAGRLVSAFVDRAPEALDPVDANWRVRFCVTPRGLSRLPARKAQERRAGGAINLNALPLARRLEALRRVLENPAPALARLRRLLALGRHIVREAFGPYRARATHIAEALSETQSALELAFNTS